MGPADTITRVTEELLPCPGGSQKIGKPTDTCLNSPAFELNVCLYGNNILYKDIIARCVG